MSIRPLRSACTFFYFFLIFIAGHCQSLYAIESYNDFDINKRIPLHAKDEIREYLMPNSHPLKPYLDIIFLNHRVTKNATSFQKAGFNTIAVTPRSFIRVAKHPWLQGYLVKVALDDELRNKRGKPEWHWFLERCKGAKQIRDVIAKHNFSRFTVPTKWIYPLPLSPQPPLTAKYTQRSVILVVEDMNIFNNKENKRAWREEITKKHLDELFVIIRDGGGSSYRADNIPFTKRGIFAFIDTEYPESKPDYTRIQKYLSPENSHYWDHLIKKYGK